MRPSGATTLLHTDSITATAVRRTLDSLIDRTAESHDPLCITGKRCNAVPASEEDWAAIQEPLHLQVIPGMTDSIIAGRKEPVSWCAKTLKW